MSNRRIKLMLLTIAACFLILGACGAPDRAADRARAGAPAWMMQGYTDALSYAPGDTVRFFISSNLPRYQVRIMRVGLEQRSIHLRENIQGTVHPIPANASTHGCGWPETFSVQVGEDWPTGYYEAFLGAPDPADPNGWIEGQTIFFVVRPSQPGRNADILLQMTTNTYNAYNGWGGHCYYADQSRDGRTVPRVSFHRPIVSQAYQWELHFIRWAETHGYRLDYATNADLHERPELLDHYKLVLSVGHDEYWSAPMRDALEAYIARGGKVAFLGGNNVCWQVRFEDDGATMVSYKTRFKDDPLYNPDGPNPLLTTLWGHHLVDRPENELTGVGYLRGGMHLEHGQFMDGSGALTVHRPDHWVFEGAAVKEGDSFGGDHTIVGYECDGCEFEMVDGRPVPTHRDGTPRTFVILATAPASWPASDVEWYDRWEKGRIGAACLGIYTVPGGGTVFTASTTDWVHGLSGGDAVVERVTRNVLDRLTR